MAFKEGGKASRGPSKAQFVRDSSCRALFTDEGTANMGPLRLLYETSSVFKALPVRKKHKKKKEEQEKKREIIR